ncbi:MAG: outer membrane protein transport protein [Planctomycetes bacterium]|nr:outer membrane protein transport protein [Planctomycetota bacterium]
MASAVDDANAVNTNPAAMAWLEGSQCSATGSVRTGESFFANASNPGGEGEGAPIIVPSFGLVVDLAAVERFAARRSEGGGGPVGALRWPHRWKAGLGFSLVGGGGGLAKLRDPIYPEGVKTGGDIQVLAVGPAVSYRLDRRTAVGLGVYFVDVRLSTSGINATRGSTADGVVRRFRQPNGTPVDPPQPTGVRWSQVFSLTGGGGESQTRALVDTRDVSGQGVMGRLGLSWRPTDRLDLGLAYRTPTVVTDLTGTVRVDANRNLAAANLDPAVLAVMGSLMDDFLPNGFGAGFASNYDFTLDGFRLPMQVDTGATWRALPWLRGTVEYRWIDWSGAFDEFHAVLDNGENLNLNEVQGSTRIRSTTVMRWRDQHVGILALEGEAAPGWTLRTGYNFGQRPAPRSTMSTTGAALTEHHLSAGLTWEIGPAALDLAWVHGFEKAETIGRSRTDANADGTRIKVYQNVFHAGAVWRF